MKKIDHRPLTQRLSLSNAAKTQYFFHINPGFPHSSQDTQNMNVFQLLRSTGTITLHTISTMLGVIALTANHPAFSTPVEQTIAQAQPSSSGQSTSSTQRVRWTPNRRLGSARTTLSGGRRGQATASCDYSKEAPSTSLTLLVPSTSDGLLTTAANPSLFWHVDTPQPISARFILSDPKTAEPIFTKTLRIEKTGIARIDLPTTVPLEVGTRYRWTVLLACKPGAFGEVAARSFIERIADADLPHTTESALDRAVAYAAEGIWYDALSTLITASQKDPGNLVLREELRSLLTQAGQRQLDLAHQIKPMGRS